MPSQIDSWVPTAGSTVKEFINAISFLDADGRKKVVESAERILGRGANPSSEVARRSTLVLGEVQSGKTLSFTTVIALSRDNGIPITVLLAGTKRPLMAQTFNQLVDDLNTNSSGTVSKWHITSKTNPGERAIVLDALNSWNDPITPPEFKRSVVLVAMKTPAGIQKVASFLKNVQEDYGKTIPCLIIDDEGDQASPNTRANEQNEFSATYGAISDLRDVLPNHSFISYTATPEAQLLIALSDHLSPESVVVLEPGPSYVGVYKLFVDPSTTFNIEIPDTELQVATDPGATDIPPKSLTEALAYFLVALSVSQKSSTGIKPISMLIHPSSTIASHTRYRTWTKSILDKWRTYLDENPIDSPLFSISSEFVGALSQIKRTNDLTSLFPSLSDSAINLQIMKLIHYWLNSPLLETRVVNSERNTHNVRSNEWGDRAGWILIGAGKLDRGFVVKNLVVTYMPRGIGGGNVDTIQQRGRFFGHKASYMSLLRGWFSNETINSYKSIFETEKFIREDLKKYDANNLDLRNWRRQMILGTNMRPTRANVIGVDHSTLDLRDNSWFQQKELFDPILPDLSRETWNRVRDLMASADETQLDRRTTDKKHLYKAIPLRELVDLLVDWPTTASDKQILDKYLVLFSSFAKTQGSTEAILYFMNQLEPRKRSSDGRTERVKRKHWKVENLQEGPRRDVYVGDREIKSEDAITIQIYNVKPRKDAGEEAGEEVLAFAISWPNGFSRRVLQQDLPPA
ncbi:Putative endonuclease, Z1 domain containing protein [Candidatus Nanopelagicaceae bacterium]